VPCANLIPVSQLRVRVNSQIAYSLLLATSFVLEASFIFASSLPRTSAHLAFTGPKARSKKELSPYRLDGVRFLAGRYIPYFTIYIILYTSYYLFYRGIRLHRFFTRKAVVSNREVASAGSSFQYQQSSLAVPTDNKGERALSCCKE
jgi:hypothetical protein